MQNSDIVLMQEAEKKYWWHVGRRLILQSVLHRFLPITICHSRATHLSSRACRGICSLKKKDIKILDVGCGTGINMQWLKQFGKVTGVDNNQQAIKLAQKYGQAIMADALKLPLPNNSFDLVTAFDVLEHIKDDQSAIKEWHRVLNNSGYLFMTVPAYQWLFGPHDKNLQHYRRYNHSQLSHLLLLSGFRIVFSSYIFMFTFPVFLIQRLIAKTTRESMAYPQIPGLINNFLIMLSKLETWLICLIRLPFGSSLIILARKQ